VAVTGFLVCGHRSSSPGIDNFGAGSQEPAALAATRSMLSGLETPAGSTLDPYSTACIAAAAVCWSSTLPPSTLTARTREQLKAAGATVLGHDCDDRRADAGCWWLFDYHGVHIGADIGSTGTDEATAGRYVALRVSTSDHPSAELVRPGSVTAASRPLGTWAVVSPLPSAWNMVASCSKPVIGGCNEYRNDWHHPVAVTSDLTQAAAALRVALTADGFRVDNARCYPPTSTHVGSCVTSGTRFRTLGGHDGESVFVALRAPDAAHVTVRISVTALP
jgi:hypothetical protein